MTTRTDEILEAMIETARQGRDIIPMFFQPVRGLSNNVSAAIRKGLKTGQIVQNGLDGCNKPKYTIAAPAATHAAPATIQ